MYHCVHNRAHLNQNQDATMKQFNKKLPLQQRCTQGKFLLFHLLRKAAKVLEVKAETYFQPEYRTVTVHIPIHSRLKRHRLRQEKSVACFCSK